MIDAFNYSDFREFLADIITGRKNLTGTQALSIAHIMKLSNEELI